MLAERLIINLYYDTYKGNNKFSCKVKTAQMDKAYLVGLLQKLKFFYNENDFEVFIRSAIQLF